MIRSLLVMLFHRLFSRTFEGRWFTRETRVLDYHTYINCRFIDCTLVLLGSDQIHIDGCSFEGCTWSAVGFAGNTLAALKALSAQEGMQDVIRATFPLVYTSPPEG